MYFNILLLLCSFTSIIHDGFGKSIRRRNHDIGDVIYVNILYRHGERTPIETYPNDPYKNITNWPCDWGQLTNTGKLQHYILGSWLRSRYIHLLPGGRYNNKAVYVRSTDVDRTLMSAEANLAGMFPPGVKDKWSAIKWQPIPVHTVAEKDDKLLSMQAPCKRYDVAFKNFLNSPEMQKINEKYRPIYEYLSLQTGKKIDNLDGVEHMYSTLLIESLANFTLPNWTHAVFPDKLKDPAALSFVIPTFTKELKRLKGGPLVKEMINNMVEKIEDKSDRNISIYSGHDTTLGNLLNTLEVYNNISPPFASAVLLELRENPETKQHFVTVLYKNSSSSSPHALTIPGCVEACPLNQFKALLNDVIPVDWDSECHSHDLFDLSNGQPYHSLAIFDMIFVIKL